jgi:hypothetical protein
MNIEKVLELLGIEKYPPDIERQIRELVSILIEQPENAQALETLLRILHVDKLDLETQKTVTENLQAAIDLAAKTLLERIGKPELERRKIKREYLAKINENSDSAINEFSKKRPQKKEEYRFDSGYGSDPMRQTKNKPKLSDYKWTKDGYSPLSGKAYKVK